MTRGKHQIIVGDCLTELAKLPASKRGSDGRFVRGVRPSPATEFKPGTHWRKPQPFRDRDWLIENYVTLARSSGDIAKEFGVTSAAVQFWLRKHKIPRRDTSAARAVKAWRITGPANGMYGRKGRMAPSWKHGMTPERQAFSSTPEWKEAQRKVWARERATCKRCRAKPENGRRFDVHHIVTFGVKELRLDLENLVLLCRSCHRFVHSKKNVRKEFLK